MRAVLFDLDGTLLAANGSIRATLDAVLTEAGLPPIPPGEILVGMPLRDILAARTEDAAAVEAMVHRYREVFLDEGWRQVAFEPGMAGLLERLAARVPLAVVTTKGQDEAEELLARLGVADRFATVVGDDDRRPVKPHPAPVVEACRRLGIPPDEAVMVGDTAFDIDAGHAAGAATVGVLWGHGTPDAHARADHVAADAGELEALLLRLTS